MGKKFFWGIFLTIDAYLLIGVIFTVLWLPSVSFNRTGGGGDAVILLLLVTPLIWPVVLPQVIDSAWEESSWKKEEREDLRVISLQRYYPPEYHILWEYFYGSKFSKPVKRTFDETFAGVHAQFMAGNLPHKDQHTDDFIRMAEQLYAKLQHKDAGAACIELLNAPNPRANLIGAYFILDNSGVPLETSCIRPLAESSGLPAKQAALPVAQLTAAAVGYKKFFRAYPDEFSSYGIGLLHHARAERLPPGRERGEAARAAMSAYREAALRSRYHSEVAQSVYRYLLLNDNPEDRAELLRQAAERFRKESGKARPVEDAEPDGKAYVYLTPRQPDDLFRNASGLDDIPNFFFPLFPSDTEKLEATRHLIPMLLSCKNPRLTPYKWPDSKSLWVIQRFLFDEYARTGNTAWADLFLELAEGRGPYDVNLNVPPGLIPYYQALVLFIHGDEQAATALLRRHKTRLESSTLWWKYSSFSLSPQGVAWSVLVDREIPEKKGLEEKEPE